MPPDKTTRGRDAAATSRMMAAVKSKDTKAEIAVRRGLFAKGFRYRIHYRVTGKPDIVFPTERIAVFIDGDFWHGNAWQLRGLASLEELFPNRTEWWVAKITRTMERDREVIKRLAAEGWEVLLFWESAVEADLDDIVETIADRVRQRRDAGRG